MLENISGSALYGNNYKNQYPDNMPNFDMPLTGTKEENTFLAQSPAPKNLESSPLLAEWIQLCSSPQESTPSEIQEEFKLIRQFCQENGNETISKHPNPFFKNYELKIMFTESQPKSGKPEKYTVLVRKIILVKEGNEIKKYYFLESTTNYEHYPADNELNERITKIYTQELYKRDPKTGAYITDRDKLTNLPKVLTKSRTIEIKDEKALEVSEDQDEDAILEKYMEEEGLDEEAKGVKKRRLQRAKKRLKAKLEDKFKKDYFVRWNDFPMRNTTAQKMLSIRGAVRSCNYTRQNKDGIIAKVEYDIQITCTTGGSHLVWQHKSGYAVDYVITKKVTLLTKDKNTGKETILKNKKTGKDAVKFVYLSVARPVEANKQNNAELQKIINAILRIEDKNLYSKDEYIGSSTLKRGDHMHAHIVDPVAEVAARYPAEPGAKSADMASSQDIREAFSLMNGYMPSELK